jgi:hypothetical protein
MPIQVPSPEPIPQATVGEGGTLLNVPYCSQCKPNGETYQNLCWAACCQMVLLCNGTPVAGIPGILAQVIGPACGANPDQCDETYWPTDAYHLLKYQCSQLEHPFDMTALNHEIVLNQRPVEALFEWTGGGSHVVIIAGIVPGPDGDFFLTILDPIRGHGVFSYDYVFHAYGSGYWVYTFYEMIKGN